MWKISLKLSIYKDVFIFCMHLCTHTLYAMFTGPSGILSVLYLDHETVPTGHWEGLTFNRSPLLLHTLPYNALKQRPIQRYEVYNTKYTSHPFKESSITCTRAVDRKPNARWMGMGTTKRRLTRDKEREPDFGKKKGGSCWVKRRQRDMLISEVQILSPQRFNTPFNYLTVHLCKHPHPLLTEPETHTKTHTDTRWPFCWPKK